jgi:dTDP-4-amino-4,6-dideoxygalactose transaminase
MIVPFLNLTAASLSLAQRIEEALLTSARSGYHVMGPGLERFEVDFGQFLGAKHVVGLGNGLDALKLGLQAMGVGPGDEVIVPAHTYIATWLAVSQCGAVPVPVSVSEQTYNIDPEAIGPAVSARTKAILAVHLYGQPADLKKLRAVAQQHRLLLLEDAAQAHGALHGGERVGAVGTAAFSFYPTKNLGALGDGGALVSDDTSLANHVMRLRNYGSSVKYHHEIMGTNSRLDPIQASVLSVKLEALDCWNERRREIAARYSAAFSANGLTPPFVPPWAEPVWHLYVLRHPERNKFQQRLQDAGIGTMIHYPIPPHQQKAYAELELRAGTFPLEERLAQEVISLPMCPAQTDAQTDYVIDRVLALY